MSDLFTNELDPEITVWVARSIDGSHDCTTDAEEAARWLNNGRVVERGSLNTLLENDGGTVEATEVEP